VGGLVEAFSGYQGALFIDPCNIDQLADAIQKSYKLKGKNFPDPHPWQKTINTYERIFKQMELRALPLK
jgi:hypothetical protein